MPRLLVAIWPPSRVADRFAPGRIRLEDLAEFRLTGR